MKILCNEAWREHDGLIKKLIREKNRQEEVIDVLMKEIYDLRAHNSRLISQIIAKDLGAKAADPDIDFPNSERKEDYESSNIFDL